MKRIIVTRGTTVKMTKSGEFLSTDSKDKITLKKGTILELLDLVYTTESMLARDVRTNIKFLLPQMFLVDYCVIDNLPFNAVVNSIYVLHDEMKDNMDIRHVMTGALIVNALLMLGTIATLVITLTKVLS